jgi:hypothetical protein
MIQANWEVMLEDIIKQNICHAVLIKSLNKPLARTLHWVLPEAIPVHAIPYRNPRNPQNTSGKRLVAICLIQCLNQLPLFSVIQTDIRRSWDKRPQEGVPSWTSLRK